MQAVRIHERLQPNIRHEPAPKQLPGPADYVSTTHSIAARVAVRRAASSPKRGLRSQSSDVLFSDEETLRDEPWNMHPKLSRQSSSSSSSFRPARAERASAQYQNSNQDHVDKMYREGHHEHGRRSPALYGYAERERKARGWGAPDPVVYGAVKRRESAGVNVAYDSIHADRRAIWALQDAWEQSSKRFAEGTSWLSREGRGAVDCDLHHHAASVGFRCCCCSCYES
jgi:hypothetical protein